MSTETVESVGVATFTEIVEAMDFHLACEHDHHKYDPAGHDGDAAWVQEGLSPCCDYPIHRMVCDRYRETLRSGATVMCTCGELTPSFEWFHGTQWVKL